MPPDLVIDLDVGSPSLPPFMHLVTELPSCHLVFPYKALHSLFLSFNSHFIKRKPRQPALTPAARVRALKQGREKAAHLSQVSAPTRLGGSRILPLSLGA